MNVFLSINALYLTIIMNLLHPWNKYTTEHSKKGRGWSSTIDINLHSYLRIHKGVYMLCHISLLSCDNCILVISEIIELP